MNTLADTIRDELKKVKESRSLVQTAKMGEYEPTNRECAAIPCAYLGAMDNCKDYVKPKKNVCAALPCVYDWA